MACQDTRRSSHVIIFIYDGEEFESEYEQIYLSEDISVNSYYGSAMEFLSG